MVDGLFVVIILAHSESFGQGFERLIQKTHSQVYEGLVEDTVIDLVLVQIYFHVTLRETKIVGL